MIEPFVYPMIFIAGLVTGVGLTVVSFLCWIGDRIGKDSMRPCINQNDANGFGMRLASGRRWLQLMEEAQPVLRPFGTFRPEESTYRRYWKSNRGR
jgi:hypothetical protein